MLKMEGFEGERKKYGRTKTHVSFYSKIRLSRHKNLSPNHIKKCPCVGCSKKQIKRGEMKWDKGIGRCGFHERNILIAPRRLLCCTDLLMETDHEEGEKSEGMGFNEASHLTACSRHTTRNALERSQKVVIHLLKSLPGSFFFFFPRRFFPFGSWRGEGGSRRRRDDFFI